MSSDFYFTLQCPWQGCLETSELFQRTTGLHCLSLENHTSVGCCLFGEMVGRLRVLGHRGLSFIDPRLVLPLLGSHQNGPPFSTTSQKQVQRTCFCGVVATTQLQHDETFMKFITLFKTFVVFFI